MKTILLTAAILFLVACKDEVKRTATITVWYSYSGEDSLYQPVPDKRPYLDTTNNVILFDTNEYLIQKPPRTYISFDDSTIIINLTQKP